MKKLSDLIEEGCRLVPQQTFHSFFERGLRIDRPSAACALGAALCAEFPAEVKYRSCDVNGLLSKLNRKTGMTLFQPAINPVTGWPERSLAMAIQRLNDKYHWSREKIATWLRSAGY